MEALMNVLFITPLSAGIVHGGVRTQSYRTALLLEEKGNHVTRFDPWNPPESFENFDLAHIFLAGGETLNMALRLSEANIPLVVSPVFFTRREASSIRISRRVESFTKWFVKGVTTDYSVKSTVCKAAALVLPNTQAEAELVEHGLGVPSERICVVPNGVDPRFSNGTPDLFHQKYGIKNFILFAGDAGAPRKNIWRLLKAFEEIDKDLVIIGSFGDTDYGDECKKQAGLNERVLLIDTLDHDDPLLASAFAAADTFILPSQFETPGIAAMEAALAGCKIVITQVGGTSETFGDDATYLNPNSIHSIRKAVQASSQKPKSDVLKNRLSEHYTWAKVAERTHEAYRKITG
jgi:glycosyltransferase involved in cell wall biosynthesis